MRDINALHPRLFQKLELLKRLCEEQELFIGIKRMRKDRKGTGCALRKGQNGTGKNCDKCKRV